MKKYNFPFTAIIGQDNLQIALLLNLVDPKIGGVLLTGQQGTGKSTAVRSLIDILPEIEEFEGCQFHCDPKDKDNLCDFCQTQGKILQKHQISLVNMPLGATEDMVIGSLDIEKIIKEGKRAILPGLLAKAHRGILYIDEINLLQDHLVDILLDTSASGVNVVEREGISLSHPANFILVGSMNPEEGELRPQISDRLGIEVNIRAPMNPKTRAEISRRVIAFNDNPEKFIDIYLASQLELKARIKNAKNILDKVMIPMKFYFFASQIVIKLGLLSQRADITFLRCARAHAALRGSINVEKEDLRRAAYLVFENRIKRVNEQSDAKFLGETFEELYAKIPEAHENPDLYEPSEKDNPNIFKFSPDVKDKFRENPLDKKNADIPEVEQGDPSRDRHSNFNLDESPEGYKAGEKSIVRKRDIAMKILGGSDEDVKIDVRPILEFLKTKRQITNFSGRGNRVRVLTKNTGHYIFAQQPRSVPKSIAFDASIKSHFLHLYLDQINPTTNALRIPLNMEDIQEKVFELHAPLTLYFIVDASASMCKTLPQIIKVIQSVHSEGYKKKDKVSVISFQGREVRILQRPNVSLSVGLRNLLKLEPSSYTPLASAMRKTMTMIQQEEIKGATLPIIIIMSDLGANISQKFANLNAQSNEDFRLIADELEEIAREIGKRKIRIIMMKPKKSFATRYLGVNPMVVQRMQESFIQNSNCRIFEFDAYDPKATIIQLKKILD